MAVSFIRLHIMVQMFLHVGGLHIEVFHGHNKTGKQLTTNYYIKFSAQRKSFILRGIKEWVNIDNIVCRNNCRSCKIMDGLKVFQCISLGGNCSFALC